MTVSDLRQFYQGKNVLVTGGAGFIGSHVVESLVSYGAGGVRVPIRKTTSLNYLSSVETEIELVEADLFDKTETSAVVEDVDIILHLAAAKGGGIEHSMAHHGTLFRDNMRIAINMIDAIHKLPKVRFVSVSSACVYPRQVSIPTPEEEGFLDVPEPTNAGYGWSKRMQEYLATSFADEFGLDVCIVRPFNTYGPRDDFFLRTNHVIPGLIRRVVGGESPLVVWGSGQQTRSFLYVEDCARGILLAGSRSGVRGPINLGNDEEISIGDLARKIVDAVGRDVEIRFDRSKPDGQPRRACDTRRAKEELGFKTKTPLAKGLRRAIDWYLREKRLKEAVN